MFTLNAQERRANNKTTRRTLKNFPPIWPLLEKYRIDFFVNIKIKLKNFDLFIIIKKKKEV